jgi:hypothetical protein
VSVCWYLYYFTSLTNFYFFLYNFWSSPLGSLKIMTTEERVRKERKKRKERREEKERKGLWLGASRSISSKLLNTLVFNLKFSLQMSCFLLLLPFSDFFFLL